MGVRIVVIGVAGSGKTTVGALLARRLGVEFADADEFHSPHNIATMAAGVPLTDDDRWPWLEDIAQWLADHAPSGCVVACSALRRAYRDVLRRGAPDAWFVYLAGTPEMLSSRVDRRDRHFMPADLVASQLEALEPPEADERALQVDAALPAEQILDVIVAGLALRPDRPREPPTP